jgi:hypothetical protein
MNRLLNQVKYAASQTEPPYCFMVQALVQWKMVQSDTPYYAMPD